ncbi:hypothetical protein XELAEV_18008099mg [Xenopus laevis]|uniref:Uncharacterized protein n=1 Tax=Xenopus laevis TaxID=8355 RepID=A0A974I5P5_XENLA|nr:hypothetical protein XELAEV_18008099mg [Xenopus laevis]
MASDLEAILARIRSEAESRGDEWLRRLLPEQDAQQPGTHAMKTRRSRPPTRLSPSPPICRRRPISSSAQIPAGGLT